MKDRAAKSFGGPCMSKFIHESERKRLARLKSTKSSISSGMKHDSWTSQHVEKRRQNIMIQRKRRQKEAETRSAGEFENIKFQLRSIDSETTRSGLKLKLANDSCRNNEAKKSIHRLRDKSDKSKTTAHERRSKHPQEVELQLNKNKNMSSTLNDNNVASTEEGKENRRQQPSSNQSGGDLCTNTEDGKDMQETSYCQTKISAVDLVHPNKKADEIIIDQKYGYKEIVDTSKVKAIKSNNIRGRQRGTIDGGTNVGQLNAKRCGKGTKSSGDMTVKNMTQHLNHNLLIGRNNNNVTTSKPFEKHVETKNIVRDGHKELEKGGSQVVNMCKKGTNTSATNCKSYLKSGASLKALTKERKEALVILKEINKGSVGRENIEESWKQQRCLMLGDTGHAELTSSITDNGFFIQTGDYVTTDRKSSIDNADSNSSIMNQSQEEEEEEEEDDDKQLDQSNGEIIYVDEKSILINDSTVEKSELQRKTSINVESSMSSAKNNNKFNKVFTQGKERSDESEEEKHSDNDSAGVGRNSGSGGISLRATGAITSNRSALHNREEVIDYPQLHREEEEESSAESLRDVTDVEESEQVGVYHIQRVRMRSSRKSIDSDTSLVSEGSDRYSDETCDSLTKADADSMEDGETCSSSHHKRSITAHSTGSTASEDSRDWSHCNQGGVGGGWTGQFSVESFFA